MDVRIEFGALIKERRKHLGLSQEVLAERAGLHRTYVTDVERGGRNITLVNISKLVGALGLSMKQLLPFYTTDKSASEATQNTPLAAARSDQVDILMVDHGSIEVQLTMEAFKRAKLTNHIHVESTAEDALDFIFCRGKYRKRMMDNLPGAILLSLSLPRISGLEVLRRIKTDERTRKIKVIVLCATQRQEGIREALQLGAAGYIIKPVDFGSFSQIMPRLDFSWSLMLSNGSSNAADALRCGMIRR